jgi:hypothetical protein
VDGSGAQKGSRNYYPRARRLLITADGGDSNGSRLRLWKTEIQKLADELKIPISICHFPPGTSKVEQDRAPVVFRHQSELARKAVNQKCGHRKADCSHPNGNRPEDKG